MGIRSALGSAAGSRVGRLAPGPTSAVVHRALARAIHGLGPLDGAAEAGRKQLDEQDRGSRAQRVDAAIDDLIAHHAKFAGAEGFATNLGGLATMAATVPANLAGLALVQCRMVAAIASLRGYDLEDPRVRNAVLSCVLGEKTVTRLVRKGVLPARPRRLAAGGDQAMDADRLDRVVAGEVAASLVTSIAGRRAVTTVGKRIPLVGGVVGAGTDALATRAIGRYAARELTPVES